MKILKKKIKANRKNLLSIQLFRMSDYDQNEYFNIFTLNGISYSVVTQ